MKHSSGSARRAWLLVAFLASLGCQATASASTERQSLEELRNTVINLLQALVDQGVLSREKAQQLVKVAQDKATADAAVAANADEGSVRVPYVPQIVKDEISKQVAQEMKPEVVAEVLQTAKSEKWGVPGALPSWLTRVRVLGDIRLRTEDIIFADDNQRNFYLDFLNINAKGGFVKAGPAAFLNVSENRLRFRVRGRIGFESDINDWLKAGIRLSTGNTTDPGSQNQTLGTTSARYNFGVDQIYLRVDEKTPEQFSWLTAVGGRMPSPWFAPTDLIYHKDLSFEGLSVTGRYGFGDRSPEQSHAFLTIGAFPIQEIELSSRDKTLFGAQLGANLRWGSGQRLRIAAAYYDFKNVVGRLNDPESSLLDFTAPQFLRQGNSLFDIRNDTDPTTNLFALASKFRLVNVAASYELPLGRYSLGISAEAVRNTGFNRGEILARTGSDLTARTKGYQTEFSFGSPQIGSLGSWRALLGYRYLQRDAVLDSLTDSDFHGGGTDGSGFYLIGDYGLGTRSSVRLRYQSANEIDGPTLGVDTIQLDLNAQF